LQQRDVVAEGLPEAAGLQEVALHVDDDHGAALEVDGDGFWFGVDDRCRHGPPVWRGSWQRDGSTRAGAFCTPLQLATECLSERASKIKNLPNFAGFPI